MKFEVVSSVNFDVDTIVRFVKAGQGVTFGNQDIQTAYNKIFDKDNLIVDKDEIKTLRFQFNGNFCNFLIAGFDNNAKNPFDDFRKLLAKLGTALVEIKAVKVLLDTPNQITFANEQEILRQIASAIPLCEYAFDKNKTVKNVIAEKTVSILSSSDNASCVLEGESIAKGMVIARDLVNEVSEVLTPENLANTCVKFGEEFGFDTQVFDEQQCREMGMNLFLAVARGSVLPPKLIVMRYKGGGEETPIGIVGKGVTYDSGGLAIKSSGGMQLMRYDMNGAAAAIGAMCVIALNKLNKNVVAVVAACENMIDAHSYRNGDVFKSMNGKTVYISSTDAEGRLTMADALTYCIRKEKPSQVIELAGLTGTVCNFYGPVCAAALTTDNSMFEHLVSNSVISGEKYALLPDFEEYREMLKTPHADLNNSTETAGGITAGMFIEAFHEDTPFIHLDLGITVFTRKKSDCQPEGGTGFGVKSLYYYVKSLQPIK